MGENLSGAAASHGPGYVATSVSPEDVKRVVGRALSGGTRRIRLTHGQRLAIVNASRPAEGAGA